MKQTDPAAGNAYIDWYAAAMDRKMQKSPDSFYQPWRVYQLQYLVAHGLTPDMHLLDYGCGPCGAGVFMIEFLQPGKYTGADISAGCLARAREFLQERGATEKRPNLVHLPGGSLEPLGGMTFDIIWAQSVLTHLPPAQTRALLSDLPKRLRRGSGAFYATFLLGSDCRQEGPKNFYYTERFFREACADAGVSHSILDDYRHPNDPHLPDRQYAVLKIHDS